MATRHVLSYGGGVNSVALIVYLTTSELPLDEVVFADTGGETPETYDYLNVIRPYLDRVRVPFTVVSKRSRGEDLYATAERRRVIPSAIWRWCTRDFKVNPIYRYYRSLECHITQYLGIAYDEVMRIKDSGVSYVTNHYPLVDHKINREGCVRLIEEAGLPVPEKSGCYFCPFNSTERWRWLTQVHPELVNKAIYLEENSKHYPNQRLTDQVYRTRASVTLRQMKQLLMANMPVPDIKEGQACGGECMT